LKIKYFGRKGGETLKSVLFAPFSRVLREIPIGKEE